MGVQAAIPRGRRSRFNSLARYEITRFGLELRTGSLTRVCSQYALDFLHSFDQSAREAPYGDSLAALMVAFIHRVGFYSGQASQIDATDQPSYKTGLRIDISYLTVGCCSVGGYTRFFELAGGSFAEAVVRGLFGFQPGIEGESQLSRTR